jgi:hypothetical protein
MKNKRALVITSIANDQHPILQQFAHECISREIPFYLMGDTKSPAHFELEGCNYFSIDAQISTGFSLVDKLPVRHYSRKNIGYLLAIQDRAEEIIESDDDNIPLDNFWDDKKRLRDGVSIANKGWVNIFKCFTKDHIWPRGFPLELIQESLATEIKYQDGQFDCPIQMGLVQKNPDVDAIYRMTQKLPIYFEENKNVILTNNTWSPFNSQNTIWFKEAFPLLYLPSYCSFRMTDIWRSFIAQRIAWENNWSICIHSPAVVHERNEAVLMNDFSLEVPGYLNNLKISQELENLQLQKGTEHMADNLIKCYERMVQLNLIEEKELELISLWNKDLKLLISQ